MCVAKTDSPRRNPKVDASHESIGTQRRLKRCFVDTHIDRILLAPTLAPMCRKGGVIRHITCFVVCVKQYCWIFERKCVIKLDINKNKEEFISKKIISSRGIWSLLLDKIVTEILRQYIRTID